MSDYRNFADSIFSSEIWNNEGRFWLILAVTLLAITAVFHMFGRSYRNQTLMTATFYGTVCIFTVAVCVGIFGQFITNDFNRVVAQKNLAVKYDDSKLQHYIYDPEARILKVSYTDADSKIREDITFAFEKDDSEPFLVKSNNSDENFSKIEQAILKNN